MNVNFDRNELLAWLEQQGDAGGELLGAGYQAVVTKYVSPWGRIVVKRARDHSQLAWLAKMAIRRESMIYERLVDIPGIPRSFGLVHGNRLVLEHVAGPSLREQSTALDERNRFFDRLLHTILAMHAAGVAHGDLKRKENIVVGPDETPYIIDFGVARENKEPQRWTQRYLFDLVRQMDLNAWVKLKYGRRPEALLPEEMRYYRPLVVESVARWIRIPWQTITLRRARQRRRKRLQD